MYDIIIIGAGTAGMSAAIYGMRAGKKVLLLEEKTYGGQIVNTKEVENYPGISHISGFEFAQGLYEQTKELGAEYLFEKVTKIVNLTDKKVVITGRKEYEGKSVIIATGCKKRMLGLEREEALTGMGVSYCATCDGAFFKGKDVAVVGGGNTALEDAGFLSEYCHKVYLIHRRDQFRGEVTLLEYLQKKENVEFILQSTVNELLGEERLEGIIVEHQSSKEKREISVAGIFIAIGQIPGNEAFADVIDLDNSGYVIATENCKTNQEGIFAAGDCRTKPVRQLTTAAADGAVAALEACKYLEI